MGSAEPEDQLAGPRAGVRLTGSATTPLVDLPGWVRLFRAPNPGPMTLTGTNSWVLGAPGQDGCVVVDPGPADEEHLAALAGERPRLTLITHDHPDHVEGLDRWRALAPDTRLHQPSRGTVDGEVLRAAGLTIEIVPTPGHTTDSTCYLVSCGDERVILTGDTVLGAGTTVVMWPDGDLGAYLASLARLRDLGAGLPVLPGHGPALADCAAAAEFYLAHRRVRLGQVRAALADGATGVDTVLARVYPDIAPEVRPAAELTVRAQLAYLRDREHNPSFEPLDTT
ncbi:MBL fold metallo-hydrolase [Actinocatenispora sera]|uniref:MBL fold metallo-hydrolase n=1 Tax=Actinocatenispora sera TaxID=390989 RepID=A0A810KWI1_9ACTN|nr:MBL fold metallo-hydrolase [Actinocatenispora sera]